MDSQCMKCNCGSVEPLTTKQKLINLLGFTVSTEATLALVRGYLVDIIAEMGAGE
jgi:hypothetical protein